MKSKKYKASLSECLSEDIDASINAADFGSEFLNEPDNVVTLSSPAKPHETPQQRATGTGVVSKWSPEKTPILEALESKGNLAVKIVPGAGLEPARPFRILGF